MSDDKDDQPEALGSSWAHLFPGLDLRTDEERKEADRREHKRRHGGNRNWWKYQQPAANDE